MEKNSVTVDAILAIEKGESKTFKVNHPRQLGSARVTANYVQKNYPENGLKYSCSCDYPRLLVTITALDK